MSGSKRPTQPPKLSAELFIIPLEGSKHIVYAPLRQAAFIGNDYVADYVRRLQRGQWRADRTDDSLLELLRGLKMVDAGPERRPLSVFDELKPKSLALFLTTACNLRCAYCYASAGGHNPQRMDLSTARRGIDFVAANARSAGCRTLDISYHGGGEPTVNWAVLTGSVDYARRKAAELGLLLRITLTTNGVLSEAQRDWVRANVTTLTVSCDGTASVHDRFRKDSAGAPSSDEVFATLDYLDRVGFRYGIRATVTAETVDSLAESVTFLCSRFRFESLQIEPVYLMGRARGAATAESKRFVDAFREARRQGAAEGRRIWFSGARLGTLTNHFCGATQENFCLAADGAVSSCYEAYSVDVPCAEVFFYGRPAADGAGYSFDLNALGRLRSQAVENRSFCEECFARWTCGGDCYYKWRTGSRSTEFDGSPRCQIIRELTKDQILEKISESGQAFWRGGN